LIWNSFEVKNTLTTADASEPYQRTGKLEDTLIPHNYHRPDPISGPDFSGI
jgi:hypothetical protein